MAKNSNQLHEAVEALDPETIDRHRAIVSLVEEFDAIDWYQQRIDATDDEELAAILAHNRDEEREHAAMTLEWLRRRDPGLDKVLRTYLFTEGSIVDLEEEEEEGGSSGHARPRSGGDGSLGIGSLRQERS
ncbi:ferritin [Persicimonas caeni]|uniref:Ferritin n=1 Tax=Persicimonas caeni TaxID=2292766 RepID=A0A4Y6PMP7_PERCE|nr:ferritin-like domain-containing protein [Persicimonas caeni]QDG49576.1 ferritin [Persicimonas caeni]QED30797.1 ferritin [Persicimonas caeni]